MTTNSHLADLINALYDLKQQRKELKKVEDAALDALKPLVDPKFDELPGEPIVVGDIQLRRAAAENRSVSADLLLERGVAPDIIQYATKVTPYFSYTLRKPKTK